MKTRIPNQKVLITQNACFLENFIVQELQKRKLNIKLLGSRKKTNVADTPTGLEYVQVPLSRPESLKNHFGDVHTVITSLGFSKDKMGVFDVETDYQYHLNILREAKRAGVKKFVYLMRTEAGANEQGKTIEKFSNVLKASGISYSILRVNALFSDFDKLLGTTHTCKILVSKEKVKRLNPIHPKDLAKACVEAIETLNLDITIGGPEILTSKEIIKMALKAHENSAWLIFPNTLTHKLRIGKKKWLLRSTTKESIGVKYGKIPLDRFFKDRVDSVDKCCHFQRRTFKKIVLSSPLPKSISNFGG